MIIKLPSLSSFYQPQGSWMITNDYTGSMGTDPELGCFNREIFKFRIFIEGKAEDPVLKVECCTQLADRGGVKNFNEKEQTFEPTAEGLTALNEWLDEQYLAYREK